MSSSRATLAVDAMGGDFGPSVVIPGALQAARLTGAKVLLAGREEAIRSTLEELSVQQEEGELYEVVNATQVVEMTDKPSEILRSKKDSSMQVACRLVREGKADAFISAGHSGAAFACGMFILGRIPGVERPALASLMPTEKSPMLLLDVGANVECRPHHLFQFALMGSTFVRDIMGYEAPRVGILSIGEEEGKGNSLVKSSYELLKQASHLNFIGNVEGRDLFTGDIDVAVCDGFVGNIALKLSEGLANSLAHVLKRELMTNGTLPKLGAMLSMKAFQKFKKVVDYAEYGGAPLLGLKGIAIVCHGKSSAKAISSAVVMANTYVVKGTQQRLVEAISANEELSSYARLV
ncbi:phosphate acyltransferase PlsX [uncultured Mailhella sp.]|uniref:phosphate acyltransferase PlsX n=1 Tax=uncultured Mailhella sp. TaxID=1981031 RepID=UPI00262A7BB7|nr:phosphate acyltransferase PlsX [uncultured Mailhella sp.]